MEEAIFELKCLQKLFLAPTNSDDTIDMSSSHMCSDDRADFYNWSFYSAIERLNQDEITEYERNPVKNRIIELFYNDNIDSLEDDQPALHMNDEQFGAMINMFRFFLDQNKLFQEKTSPDYDIGTVTFNVIYTVMNILFRSNMELESKHVLREHMQNLKGIRSKNGDSLLHKAAYSTMLIIDQVPCRPILRFLIEEGKMNVNVANSKGATPLHMITEQYWKTDTLLSGYNGEEVDRKLNELKSVANLLIYNGAHMDRLDVYGNEASSYLSHKFPQWSMNASLKCLAAKAILRHNLPYKKVVPANLFPFIEVHREEDYEIAEEKYSSERYMLNEIRQAKRRRSDEEMKDTKKRRIDEEMRDTKKTRIDEDK